jgi:hypothetical protein
MTATSVSPKSVCLRTINSSLCYNRLRLLFPIRLARPRVYLHRRVTTERARRPFRRVFLYYRGMKTTRTKRTTATASPLREVSSDERSLLTAAYKSGLISGWKMDPEHGYRLTLANYRDEYVEVANLTVYLEGLRKKLA